MINNTTDSDISQALDQTENMAIASLPMYDWPEVQKANNTLWTCIRGSLQTRTDLAPVSLCRSGEVMQHWSHPKLFFSQTCGLPYLRYLVDRVSLLGTPVYQIEGCRGAWYSSQIVSRRRESKKRLEDFQFARFAFNDEGSQSGFNAMRFALAEVQAPAVFFNEGYPTGSHRASLAAVAYGDADICAIDPLSWALALRYDQDVVEKLQVIGQSPYTPGLPYIRSNTLEDPASVSVIRCRLGNDINGLPKSVSNVIHLSGIDMLETTDYAVIQLMQDKAELLGHKTLFSTPAVIKPG